MAGMVTRKKLIGNSDLVWLVMCTVVCSLFVGVLLRYLSLRHEVYQLGYQMADETREHSLLLEENRRLLVEAALLSNTERLEEEALERLGLRPTEPSQIVNGVQH